MLRSAVSSTGLWLSAKPVVLFGVQLAFTPKDNPDPSHGRVLREKFRLCEGCLKFAHSSVLKYEDVLNLIPESFLWNFHWPSFTLTQKSTIIILLKFLRFHVIPYFSSVNSENLKSVKTWKISSVKQWMIAQRSSHIMYVRPAAWTAGYMTCTCSTYWPIWHVSSVAPNISSGAL